MQIFAYISRIGMDTILVKEMARMSTEQHDLLYVKVKNIYFRTTIITFLIGAIFGGLLNGPEFYRNDNLTTLCLCFGGSMVTYIVNRVFYESMYGDEDKELQHQIKHDSENMWNESVEALPSMVNQEY